MVITVLEGEDDGPALGGSGEDGAAGLSGWGMMSVLSGCMTVASAAIADAGIDCSDLVSGGVAAVVRQPIPPYSQTGSPKASSVDVVLDPCPSEHSDILAVCVVGYLRSRDEITEIWTRGDVDSLSGEGASEQSGFDVLLDRAVEAAVSSRLVLDAALKEATEYKLRKVPLAVPSTGKHVE